MKYVNVAIKSHFKLKKLKIEYVGKIRVKTDFKYGKVRKIPPHTPQNINGNFLVTFSF